MKISAELLSIDFIENTITFEVDNTFMEKIAVTGGDEISTIECPNIKIKEQ